jgi:hypothetical protein
MEKPNVFFVLFILFFTSNLLAAEIDLDCELLWRETSAAQSCTLISLEKYSLEEGRAVFCTIEADCKYQKADASNMIEKSYAWNKETFSVNTIVREGLNNCGGDLTYLACK